MNLERDTMLTFKQRCRIVDKALRDFYKKDIEEGQIEKSDVNDLILQHTEGGEAEAIAYAIACSQEARTRKIFLREVYA